MLQKASATEIPIAETEEYVMKILRIKITRARASQALSASTVKLVSSRVTFL